MHHLYILLQICIVLSLCSCSVLLRDKKEIEKVIEDVAEDLSHKENDKAD